MYGVMPYTWSQLLGIGGNARPAASEQGGQGGQGKAAGGAAQYQIGESGLEVTTGKKLPRRHAASQADTGSCDNLRGW